MLNIIQLAESVRLTDSVLPICLPNTYEDDALATSAGKYGEVSTKQSKGLTFIY